MSSRSWNRVELMGNLTRDPELRFTPNGAAVCTFGLATNRSFMVEGERREDVDFHRLVAWNKLAELCNQLLKKGTRVFISGRLSYREWEGQDGQKKRDTEIVVEDMIIVSPKGGSSFGEDAPESSSFGGSKPVAVAPADDTSSTDSKPEDGKEEEKKEEEKKESKKPTEDVSEDLPF